MDLIVRTGRLPDAGETVMGGSFETLPGGKGANQAVAAARAGAHVSMIGCVGDDAYGGMLLETLSADHVDVQGVRTLDEHSTGIAQITVDDEGENTIVVAGGANRGLTTADVIESSDAIRSADVLLMQLETPIETVMAAATFAREVGVTVMLNAAPGMKLPLDLAANIDVLIANETEAAIAAGNPALDDADRLAALSLLGIRSLIVTLGDRGAQFMHERKQGEQQAYRVSPIDSVGAGDAFAGTFAARYSEHKVAGGVDELGFVDAVCWASAAGALATTARGAIPSLPRRAAIKQLLTRLSERDQ
jgi:ribokinase